eukprot:CAMPEP_0170595066 /NCGR_PEP_ID=MMETSP0224-20130122/14346_1 /TAXON_ID=285029 /ORGANISM="Togula jolla, Strain CCCM 725" /LENGTH=159 /DNA_ID=CAMNT_0010919187 /DNA_START=85 /DNA_END=564 /DNA_ORIENTATION=-
MSAWPPLPLELHVISNFSMPQPGSSTRRIPRKKGGLEGQALAVQRQVCCPSWCGFALLPSHPKATASQHQQEERPEQREHGSPGTALAPSQNCAANHVDQPLAAAEIWQCWTAVAAQIGIPRWKPGEVVELRHRLAHDVMEERKLIATVGVDHLAILIN